MTRWEYATVEWVWKEGAIRLNLPGRPDHHLLGSYSEVVDLLCKLGRDCWDVASTVAESDWIYWTLKRPVE